ncbi:uncharacterized protein LOC131939410 [Physella acuta]|uniref:uncharacterized protein LOC131939410 n=1 Tax=Physella acuta TaxID=109671 RepID=UPI0027DCAC58|nr:uncharacterized protein LOC131939410 [Physella acuta]
MRNVSFLQFCGLMVTLITGVSTCDLAAEEEPYEIRYTAPLLPEGVQKVFWFKEDLLLAECSIGSKLCVVIDLRLREAKIERTENGVEFSAELANVSRQHSNNAEGNWILKNDLISHGSQIMYSCLLEVYSKPDQVYCDAKWTTDELTIRCKTNRIYPEAMMKVDIKNKTSSIISCENTRISTEPYYYRTECTYRIPTHDLHFKKNEIDIYLYPNIIGFNNSIGVNVSIDITIENPTVHGNICVDKGQYVACRCIKLHGRQDVKSVEWLQHNTTFANKGFQASFIKEQPENDDIG